MKNITVSVDDETYRRARIKAAERDTSALVRDYLVGLAREESAFERLKREEKELRKQIPPGLSAADRLPRDDLYDRGRK